ncbi:uncharacterized membrane protein (DUF485 family) [Paraburkholderia terricola]|uniref:Uncharacterized membrane protein (DUF485 family) n=1 Tax=Paraburkholderia terricola TaxID=169427 RepID=A0ABU1M200_9BURK|nr:DUF485 domain-containing protein [Paraburkholderia terricola]MDR6412800.1 uncharacterized membrane protein (DUF485 family) [Paraburkholderia terricola]MDR6495955.1 uncharacterized membrane protein (DUF485 family) [Paraburkholderia terricola]
MQMTELAEVRGTPLFAALVRRRRKFVAWLTAATLIPYYTFILVAAFAPDALATKFPGSAVMNVGWPVGAALIVGTWLLTGVYVRRANGEFDALTAEILAGEKQ